MFLTLPMLILPRTAPRIYLRGRTSNASKEVHRQCLANCQADLRLRPLIRLWSFYTSINRQQDSSAKQSTEMVDNPVEKADGGCEPWTIT